MELGPFDLAIILVISFSTLLSLYRGFIREALSLTTLIAAMVISRVFGGEMSTLLVNWIETPAVRYVTAYAGLFIATLVIGGLINRTLVGIVRFAGLGGLDRLLGMGFGLARGVLIIVVITAVLARLGFSESLLWQESIFINEFVALADWLQTFDFEEASKMFEAPSEAAESTT
jgi:membrane protein required for colicin V production